MRFVVYNRIVVNGIIHDGNDVDKSNYDDVYESYRENDWSEPRRCDGTTNGILETIRSQVQVHRGNHTREQEAAVGVLWLSDSFSYPQRNKCTLNETSKSSPLYYWTARTACRRSPSPPLSLFPFKLRGAGRNFVSKLNCMLRQRTCEPGI